MSKQPLDDKDAVMARLWQDRETLLAVVKRVAEHFADTDAPLGAEAREAIARVGAK